MHVAAQDQKRPSLTGHERGPCCRPRAVHGTQGTRKELDNFTLRQVPNFPLSRVLDGSSHSLPGPPAFILDFKVSGRSRQSEGSKRTFIRKFVRFDHIVCAGPQHHASLATYITNCPRVRHPCGPDNHQYKCPGRPPSLSCFRRPTLGAAITPCTPTQTRSRTRASTPSPLSVPPCARRHATRLPRPHSTSASRSTR
jgi:hypothetical protein